MKRTLYILALGILLTSCGRTHKIPTDDYLLIPYEGNEILVFESNQGETDTIFLQGTKSFISPTDPLDIFPTKAEHYYIVCKHSDPSPPSGRHRYLNSSLVEISMSEKNETWVEIDFAAKDAWFYGNSWLPKKEFKEMQETSFEIAGQRLVDVVVFEDSKKEYYERTNHIDKLYWSKSHGIVRYDKKDNETWKLIKKYAPQQ